MKPQDISTHLFGGISQLYYYFFNNPKKINKEVCSQTLSKKNLVGSNRIIVHTCSLSSRRMADILLCFRGFCGSVCEVDCSDSSKLSVSS